MLLLTTWVATCFFRLVVPQLGLCARTRPHCWHLANPAGCPSTLIIRNVCQTSLVPELLYSSTLAGSSSNSFLTSEAVSDASGSDSIVCVAIVKACVRVCFLIIVVLADCGKGVERKKIRKKTKYTVRDPPNES